MSVTFSTFLWLFLWTTHDRSQAFVGRPSFQHPNTPFVGMRMRLSSSTAVDKNGPSEPSSRLLDDTAIGTVTTWGFSERQKSQLVQLCHLVHDWNSRINIVSRKDCTPSSILHAHVLPSLAAFRLQPHNNNPLSNAQAVVDVGTGGGFPGLPLAIAYPNSTFTLLDSVGKKLLAIDDMVVQLGLTNVQTHHGRAEDWQQQQQRTTKFDVATGRSVSSLPQFCVWMHHLLEVDGHLMYWIGGELDDAVMSLVESDHTIETLLDNTIESDKRILIFPQAAVTQIARQSNLLSSRKTTAVRSNKERSPSSVVSATATNPSRQRPPRSINNAPSKSRGSWRRNRKDELPKQRGYEDFQRYDSTSRGSTSSKSSKR